MKTTSREELIAAEALVHHPKRVLDIAYAHGPNQELAALDAEVVGVDPLGRTAPFAAMHTVDVNVAALPFPNESFDLVTMGCVLSHLSRPLALLKEVHRVLKPGGAIILSSPNPHYYWEGALNIFYHFFKKRVSKSKHIEHFFEFTRYAMRTSLERSGFTLEKEIGSTFQVVKTGLRLNVKKHPGIAFEIIYVAGKTHEPQSFTVVEDDRGTVVHLKTDLFR